MKPTVHITDDEIEELIDILALTIKEKIEREAMKVKQFVASACLLVLVIGYFYCQY